MKFSQENQRFVLPILLSITLILGLIIGNKLSTNRNNGSIDSDRVQKITDILDVLNERYVDTIDKDKIFEEMLSEMLHKLDPHSNYIPAKEMQAVAESIDGKFGGVGIRFQIIRDTVCITNVI